MDEHAHLGTTRYTMLSLFVIHVPGKLATLLPSLPTALAFDQLRSKKCCNFNVCSLYVIHKRNRVNKVLRTQWQE